MEVSTCWIGVSTYLSPIIFVIFHSKKRKEIVCMNVTLVLSFLLASGLLAIMPGPDNIFVLTESITKGKRNGIIISAGLATGVIVHTIVIATGLAIFIQKSENLFYAIKILGALYLLYLVYQTYKEPDTEMNPIRNNAAQSSQNISFFALYKKGFLMNVLNPKVTLFFIAFMPQFVCESGAFSFEVQIIVLGVIFMVQAFLIFSGIAILADKLSQFLTSKTFWKNVKWIKMIVLTGLALFLFV